MLDVIMTSKRLQQLLEKRQKLDEQIRSQKARVRAEQTKRRRKEDTRRKIITGAIALEHASQNPDNDFARTLLNLLRAHVTEQDRHLFDFPADVESNDNTTGPTSRLANLFSRK